MLLENQFGVNCRRTNHRIRCNRSGSNFDAITRLTTRVQYGYLSFADPDKALAMRQIHTLLQGVLEARGQVMVKLNVAREHLDDVIAQLPAMKSPTVNELFGGRGYAVETVVPKNQINILIPDLRGAGATDIVELPISKIVH